jgi:hypothetical protein
LELHSGRDAVDGDRLLVLAIVREVEIAGEECVANDDRAERSAPG